LFRYKLLEQLERSGRQLGRRVTLMELAAETGVSRVTLGKIVNQPGYGTSTEVLARLCSYFGCGFEDLVELVPNEQRLPVPKLSKGRRAERAPSMPPARGQHTRRA
jgi:DNA-binding Xre family transcriptional regulator